MADLLPDTEIFIPTPKTPTRDCTRDNRIRVQTLFFQAHWSRSDIALQLNLTLDKSGMHSATELHLKNNALDDVHFLALQNVGN